MFLRLDGTTFQAQVSGPANGEVLLLLHSLGTNAGIWEEPAEAFSNRYRVIRPDLRGHGMSGVTSGPYSIEGMARDMLGLLDLMGVESAHVAGISIGGMIAQSLAAQAPGIQLQHPQHPLRPEGRIALRWRQGARQGPATGTQGQGATAQPGRGGQQPAPEQATPAQARQIRAGERSAAAR